MKPVADLQEADGWQEAFSRHGYVELSSSRTAVLNNLGIAALLEAAGIYLLVVGSTPLKVVAGVGVAFFGLGICMGAVDLFKRGSVIRVDGEGVSNRRQRVAWDEIVGVDTWSGAGRDAAMVVLHLTNEAGERIRPQLNRIARAMESRN
jgi:hypothetical protein